MAVFLLTLQAAPAFACLLPGGMASVDCPCPDPVPVDCGQHERSSDQGTSDGQALCCAPVTPSTFALSRLAVGSLTALASLDVDHSIIDPVLSSPRPPPIREPDAIAAVALRRFESAALPIVQPAYLLFERLTL